MPHELIATGPLKPVLREYEDRPPGEGEVLMRTEFSACKHGTELGEYRGVAEWMKRTRDPKLGLFTEEVKGPLYPVSLGNMGVGVIEEVGEGVETLQVGDRVFGHMGARDSHTRPASSLRKLPEGMPPQYPR